MVVKLAQKAVAVLRQAPLQMHHFVRVSSPSAAQAHQTAHAAGPPHPPACWTCPTAAPLQRPASPQLPPPPATRAPLLLQTAALLQQPGHGSE
eukprot:1157279-Pelagomonas_calceolata.AAC.6